MSDTVVDSSVVAKWILAEADSDHAERLITEVALKGERLIVLDLAFVEVTNAIWKQYHRGLATPDETRQFLDSSWISYCAALCMSNRPTASSNLPWTSLSNIVGPFTTLCLSPSVKTWGYRALRRMNHCLT